MLIAVDGHVSKETVSHFVASGARILCANTAIFGAGNPVENMRQLKLLAQAALR
jgi:pentose-5-phosphate-3-epimerase